MSGPDGLTRARPEDHGTDPAVLVDLLDQIAESGLEVHSLLIWREGALIQEAYWHPYGPERLHMMHSVTKSFTSMAVGLAFDDGLLDLDTPVIDFFPEHRAIAPAGIGAMRLRHLLTMTSGHGRGISGGAWRKLTTSWVADFLRQPLDHEPGAVFVYDSACSYMLSAIVQRVTGQTCHDYLRPRVLEPMGMSPDLRWDRSPEGICSGGNGLWCRSADLLRLGILHLEEGRWQGQQLLSADWVRAARGMQLRDISLGVLTGEVYLGPDESHEGAAAERREGYGYQWWRGPNDSFSANGLFGQNCYVFENERAVIAVTAGMEDEDRRLTDLIHNHLRPALGQWRGADLPARLAALKLKPAPPESWDAAPVGWQGSYAVAANDQGVERITLRREGNLLHFGLSDGRGTHAVLAGMGVRHEGVTSMTGARLHHAYEAGPEGFRVSAWAHWSAPDAEGWSCLTLDWAFVEMAFRDTLRIFLRDGALRLERSVNVNSSIRSLPVLTGERAREVAS
ncbi:serine hydrolase domain-containing protein [Oceanicola sp. S124]|uniref:serine hydrolase domain-containing protein n=1 Tax=Oceanicola sp. S124 TaxID=1042378 RepID=UPI0002557A09|nr:serine hydrolase domain-containing protein [Oceanicola sp. S124]